MLYSIKHDVQVVDMLFDQCLKWSSAAAYKSIKMGNGFIISNMLRFHMNMSRLQTVLHFRMTNGGKSTLARRLHQQIPNSCIIAQDTYFKVVFSGTGWISASTYKCSSDG